MRRLVPILFAALVLSDLPVSAQWLNYPDSRIPRTADGRPDLQAAAPRLADGRVDLSGVWYPDFVKSDPTAVGQAIGEDPVIRLSTVDGAPVPFLPTVESAWRTLGPVSPATACLPHTIVDALLVPSPFKFIHAPGLTILLLEEFNHFRQIFTDGRPFPTDMQPAWFGYSIGRWEGDEFVVETRGLNGVGRAGNLLDGPPMKNSEAMHITERYRRPSFGSVTVDITFDDPSAFSKPWSAKTVWFRLLPDTDFIESICDNERDVEKIKAAQEIRN